jgi:hypothetical protein
LVHVEEFESKTDAIKRENHLKTIDGGVEMIAFLKRMKILNDESRLSLQQW